MRDAMARVVGTIERPEPVSKGWWLLPPVGYVLQRRRSGEYRRRIVAAMPAEQRPFI